MGYTYTGYSYLNNPKYFDLSTIFSDTIPYHTIRNFKIIMVLLLVYMHAHRQIHTHTFQIYI